MLMPEWQSVHYSSLIDTIKDRDLCTCTEAGIRSKLELRLVPYLTTEAGTFHSQLNSFINY